MPSEERIEELLKQIAEQSETIASLHRIINALNETIGNLHKTNSGLSETINELQKTIEDLKRTIVGLTEKLGMNSRNSSMPPSTDVFDKPAPKSLRKTSGKKPGGQPGHEGNGFKIEREVDQREFHEPAQCANCACADTCAAVRRTVETRYEIDIEIRPVFTAHQAMGVVCPKTNEIITGEFPTGVDGTIQYGVNIEALAISLNTVGMVSIGRTHEILSGVFGVPISTGTIAAMVKGCAQSVTETVSNIKEALKSEPVVNFDETGTRTERKNHWAHVASTATLTHISVEEKRGKEGMDSAGILPNYSGTGIHDCWAPYFKYDEMRHGLCCAHLLRELTAVTENTGQPWAHKLDDLLIDMKNAKESLIIQGKQGAPSYLQDLYSLSYDVILAEAQASNPVPVKDPNKKGRPKRGKTGALVDRLVLLKGNYLLFFTDFSVPFDNNQAERDFRMFKVKQKVSGCFRTKGGADAFAAIMSFVGTARKRGTAAYDAIRNALLGTPFSVLQAGTIEPVNQATE